MKISIITVCFNSKNTIEDTIKSVLAQTYKEIEYIIIDGGSTDGTREILERYKNKITKIVSEPDRGMYDAMNKGIGYATGEVVGILNSDDFYTNTTVLQKVVECFEDECIDACYGDLQYVDRDNASKKVRFWRAGTYRKEKVASGWIMPHPTFFVKRDVYMKYGVFNTNFKIAGDYELMLRFLSKNITMTYVKETWVSMREGGTSARNFKQRVRGWKELCKAWKVNNMNVPIFFILRRIISKIKQYSI